MKYVKIVITRDECPTVCASFWEFGVFPEDKAAKAIERAKKVACELDRQTPGARPHEVKEKEVDIGWD